MGDEKATYEALPIPSYEEATSSRPTSSLSHSHLGPQEVSDDAERQGLLGRSSPDHDTRYPAGYHPPTVESVRSSLDFLPSSNASSSRGSAEELRRELEQMDVEEPGESSNTPSSRSLFSKRFTDFRRTLSSLHLPLRKYLPTFNFRWNFSFLSSSDASGMDHQRCIIIFRMVGLFIVVGVIYAVFISDVFSLGKKLNMGQMYEPESVRIYVQSHVNESNIAENLEMLTSFPHIAGTEGNYVLAEWVQDKFRSDLMDDVSMERFDAYLNYPKPDGRRIAIVDPPELAWEAKIDEEQTSKSPPKEQTLAFHGHSKSGNVTGPLIYANHGSQSDFKALNDMGISLDGAIVLVRHYGTRSDGASKVRAAEQAGAAGCIIYSEPVEDGFATDKPWPDGRYMPQDGVQRGQVSFMSWVVGDVLSPGFAALPDENKRLPVEENPGLPQIPSIPISSRDAQRLLEVIQGHGKTVTNEWVGSVRLSGQWWTGDSSSPKVNLANDQDEVERQPIYNVIGRITGLEQPEKKVIVGSHRDAWCFGAANPGSGTAVLVEVARIFGELRSLGWRPLRTIEFASWDGAEYNLIGSTEHVEKQADELRMNGFAYINVDVAVSGNQFKASASPLLERILLRILKRTSDPHSNESLMSLWEKGNSELRGLGAGGDYTAFQHIAGTSSIDFGFGGDPYPSHSCYDTFDWMTKVGDPGFQYHKVLGQILGLLLLELADAPVVPLDLEIYAKAISKYVSELDGYAKSKGVPLKPHTRRESSKNDKSDSKALVDMKPLYTAAEDFRNSSHQFNQWGQSWNDTIAAAGGFENNVVAIRRMTHNSLMTYFETDLLDTKDGGGVSAPFSLLSSTAESSL